jgi:hypothetical protein
VYLEAVKIMIMNMAAITVKSSFFSWCFCFEATAKNRRCEKFHVCTCIITILMYILLLSPVDKPGSQVYTYL